MDYHDYNYTTHFFEGTEKLLELWFTRKDRDFDMDGCDLRDIPREKLESLLQLVHCEVISCSQNDDIDAYVLSESSMFVAPRRFILKTCGTTTLLNCVEPLLYLVQHYTSFDEVEDIYYSRKNFMRPELQKDPHTSFEEEVKALDTLFPDGAAYCLGRMNSDCWYLFTTSPICRGGKIFRGHMEADQTLEILMTNLDPKVMSIFTKDVCNSGRDATERAGIDNLVPGMYIDDFLFEPCGYSMNGIMKDGYYMTIHITPEPNCSYVSFETNCPLPSYKDLMKRVLNVFKPGKVIMTVFANKKSASTKAHKELVNMYSVGEHQRLDVQICKLKNYDLTYALFTKFPS